MSDSQTSIKSTALPVDLMNSLDDYDPSQDPTLDEETKKRLKYELVEKKRKDKIAERIKDRKERKIKEEKNIDEFKAENELFVVNYDGDDVTNQIVKLNTTLLKIIKQDRELPDLTNKDYDINEALHYALLHGKESVVKYLSRLENRYDTTIALKHAGIYGNEELIIYIISNLKGYIPYATICYGLCEYGKSEELVKKYFDLIPERKKLKYINELFHAACKSGNLNIVRYIINQGAVEIKAAIEVAENYEHPHIEDYLRSINIDCLIKERAERLNSEKKNGKEEADDNDKVNSKLMDDEDDVEDSEDENYDSESEDEDD